MKKILLIVNLLFAIAVSRGQNIVITNNPSGGQWDISKMKHINNKIVGIYKNVSGKTQIGTYDGTSTSLINNPDTGYLGSYCFTYNNNLFYSYITINNDSVILKYDGSTLTLISNPTSSLKPLITSNSKYIAYKGDMYLILINTNTQKKQLGKFNGTTYTLINNPDLGDGVQDGGLFTYNDTLYASYSNSLGKIQICKAVGNNLVKLPHTILANNWKSIGVTDIDYKNYHYLTTYSNSFNNFYCKFNGDSLFIISNPSWVNSVTGSLFLYKNTLYSREYSSLSAYDGLNYSQLKPPYAKSNLYTVKCNHKNKMFFACDTSSAYKIMSFDSTNFVVYPSLDTIKSYEPIVTLKNYLICWSSNFNTFPSKAYLAYFNDTSINIINNPDSGGGYNGNTDTLNSTFYFFYRDINNKYQLAYLSFNSLPLKLLSFTAQKENNNVLLNWQTANEVNVSHINIQRSNGTAFTTIGKVGAKCCEYSYEDNSLPFMVDGSVLYYRLEIVDKDGSKTYSEVKNIELRSTNYEVRLFPNPAKDFVNIECKEGIKEVKIIDCLGREISHFVRNDGNVHHLSLNINHYPKGLYVVQVITNKGDVRNEKLMVK